MIEPRMPREQREVADDRRFRLLFERVAAGMCFVSITGTFLEVNPRMLDILGFPLEELQLTTCVEVTHPDDRAYESSMTARMLAGEMSAATWEKRYRRADGSYVWCNLTLTLINDEAGEPQQFVGIIEDITERKRSQQKLSESEALLRIAGETAGLGGWALEFSHVANLPEAYFAWSEEVCAIHDVSVGDVTSFAQGIAFFVPYARERIITAIDACVRFGTPFDLEVQIITALERTRWVRTSGQLEADGSRLVGAYQDITERKEAELELVRMNRALRMLSACNEAVVRATDERRLLDDVCELVVRDGGYLSAWAGYARDDAYRSVEPIAATALAREYIADVQVSYNREVPEGRGVAGQTIHSGQVAVVEDATTNPCFEPWRGRAIKHGFRSVVGLPLRDRATTFGVLALYATETASPPQAELELLQQLADDVAFGILHLQSLAEQRRVQEAVLKISAAVSVRSSNVFFFERLATNLADTVGAQGAIIARYEALAPACARTIVALVDGVLLEPFDIDLAGTPWGALISERTLVIANRLCERYPGCSLAAPMRAHAFVGARLDDSSGEPLALMFVFFREPLAQSDFAVSTLKIFAAWAAVELEREVTGARILDQASWLDRARDAIVVRGIDGRVTFWNKSAERLYGWASEVAVGSTLAELLFDDATRMRDATADVITNGFWNARSRIVAKTARSCASKRVGRRCATPRVIRARSSPSIRTSPSAKSPNARSSNLRFTIR